MVSPIGRMVAIDLPGRVIAPNVARFPVPSAPGLMHCAVGSKKTTSWTYLSSSEASEGRPNAVKLPDDGASSTAGCASAAMPSASDTGRHRGRDGTVRSGEAATAGSSGLMRVTRPGTRVAMHIA